MSKRFLLALLSLFGAFGAVPASFAQDAAPVAVILDPPTSSYVESLPSISGTAADDTGVALVRLAIKRSSDGQFWDGAAWAAAETWLDAADTASWTYSAVPPWVEDAEYAVYARAQDLGSAWSVVYATAVFTYGAGGRVSSGHYAVSPSVATDVPAGSILSPGQQALTAQLTDKYGVSLASAGVACYISAGETYGAAGSFRYQSGASWPDMGVSTVAYTDADGRIGFSVPIAYRVSSAAGDQARVWLGTAPFDAGTYDAFAASSRNVSGLLTTVGGTPSKLVFISSAAEASAGITEIPGSGAAFTVQRRDDFDNISSQGQTIVTLTLPSAQQALHAALGFSTGAAGDYGFRNTANDQFVTALAIMPGQTQISFRYHDRASSYSGASPAANTGEGGRPGYWELRAISGALQPAVHQLQVNPAEAGGVSFGNPVRTMVAGKAADPYGDAQAFRAELRDVFGNPARAAEALQVRLSTAARLGSASNDSVSFSAASALGGGVPPVFAAPVEEVTIPLGGYSATFYYLDTTASVMYPANGRAYIGVAVPSQPGWYSSTQPVNVLADTAYRMRVSGNAGQTLSAGATSQVFTLSLEDMYGNLTPVAAGQEDDADAGVAFTLTSDSGGGARFASPSPDAFSPQPGSARMKLGEATTTFYLIDTAVSETPHQLTVDTVLEKGWLTAVASYTIVASTFSHIEFYTAPRRLVAGTTVQYADYALGTTVPTLITVAMKDPYGGVATTGTVVSLRITAANDTTYGGLDPDQPRVPGLSWTQLKTSPLELSIEPGGSFASFYIWDTAAGSAPVYAAASVAGSLFSSATQYQLITPGPASYFTLHHGYTLASPLASGTTGQLTLRARDAFGNIAAGDGVNGKYYTGKVKLSVNSATAALRDAASGATYYTFTPADRGERLLSLYGTRVETLKINATDYYNPALYGYTGDGARGLPAGSSADLVQAGLVITPRDMAPEDPLPLAKTSIGLSKVALYQGDGMIPDIPAPVPMLRLTMQILPSGAPWAYLTSVRVRSTGTLAPSDIAGIGLYADNPVAGQLGLLDGETVSGGPPTDIFISSGTYDPGSMTWGFDDLHVKVSTAALLNNSPRNFFLAVRISSEAATPRSFGLALDSPSYLVLGSTLVAAASNNFPIATATSPVRAQPGTVHIEGEDIGAWWQPDGFPAGKYNYVEQGQPRVGFLKVKAWTDYNFLSVIRSLKIRKTGSGSGADIRTARLFLDSSAGDPSLGDGVFSAGVDKEVTDPLNPPAFNPADPDYFTLPLFSPAADGAVNGSTRTYFVVYEFAADASTGATHGAGLDAAGVSLIDGVVMAFQPVVSSLAAVSVRNDTLYLADVNKAAPNGFAKPSFFTQGETDRPVARLTLQLAGSSGGFALWKGLKLDRWVTAAENGDTPAWNKVSDVTGIKVWYDANGDGLLQSSGAVTDLPVLSTAAAARVFPSGALTAALAQAGAELSLSGLQAFFPPDSPFPAAPGRLVINDGQADPSLKEVVYYSGVDLPGGRFTGLTRGAEGTQARDWSTGTVVSGQAVLPLGGEGAHPGGQAFFNDARDYFVTYDIAPDAYVSNFSYLGLAVRSTDYFSVEGPDVMGSSNVGVMPPGKSVSLVSGMRESADAVVVTASDTLTGAALRQLALNQPVLAAAMSTESGDALWRWLLVYATGSVLSDGTAANDVSAVKVWHDRDDNSVLGAADVLVGTGAFGNTIYGPLVARVNFPSEQRLLTSSAAAQLGLGQRYLVTYDMRSTAMPFDALGNKRYLGAYLKAESFPQGSPAVDDASKNALSLPNTFSAGLSNLQFNSRLREIIPVPGTVTVTTEPLFSPDGSGSAPAVRLAAAVVAGAALDPAWVVTSTAGLPSSGYMAVDGEIIRYEGTAAGALTYITRGVLGTAPAAHSSGAALGGMLLQGGLNYPFLKMTLVTPIHGVRWSRLALSRLLPAGLAGSDPDVSAVKLWKDNGNGIFDRDGASGLNTSDVLVGSGRFGEGAPAGQASVQVADPALPAADYVVLGATPTVVFVTLDIDRAAAFSDERAVPQNAAAGVAVSSGGAFGFLPAASGHVAQLAAPASGPAGLILPIVNAVTAEPLDLAPASATQGDLNVGVLALRLAADRTSARLASLRLYRQGTASDADIAAVKIWRDADGDCLLGAADTAADGGGNYPNLLSYGNEAYTSGTVNVVLRTPLTVTTTPACAFISYDLSLYAPPGASAGVRISSAGDLGVLIPNNISLSTWPAVSSPLAVLEKPSVVTLGVNDTAAALVQEGGVFQAQAKVPMLRFNLATAAGGALWSAVRVQRAGASNDPAAPFGRNSDVRFVKVYKDDNRNDLLDAGDTDISGAETALALPVASTDTAPFQLVVESTAGFPAAGRLYLGGAELLSYSGTGTAASGKPYLAVTSRGDRLGGANTPALSHPAGAAARKADLFNQVNDLDTQLTVALSLPQQLGPAASSYFLAYDIGESAMQGNKTGVRITDRSWITVSAPHSVEDGVYMGVSEALPRGALTDFYPVSSSLVPVKAVTLRVSGTGLAPATAEKDRRNLPMLTFRLSTPSDYVNVGGIRFAQAGSIESAAAGYGDGDLAAASLWLDDGDGAFNPLADSRIAYAAQSAENPFESGVLLNITASGLPYLRVSTAPVTLHLACDTGAGTDLFGEDVLGHQAGLSLASFAGLLGPGGTALAASQDPADSYPLASGQLVIAPGAVPPAGVFSPVMTAPNGYPAFAAADAGGVPARGPDGLPVADTSRWIYGYTASGCRADEPLLDLDGDGRPDNFDYYGSGRCDRVSLTNSGKPSFDLDGDGLLDADLNLDYIPDRVADDGGGRPLYFIGDSYQNSRLLLPVAAGGALPSAWHNSAVEIPARWNPATVAVSSYELSLGYSPADPTGIKNGWQPAAGLTSGTVTGVALSPGHFTRLASRIDDLSSSFTVDSAEGFAAEGMVYVGSEIMLVTKVDGVTFRITQRGAQGSSRAPHTAWGETVSDRGYIPSVRGVMADAALVPGAAGAPLAVYRVDTTMPSAPGAPQPQVASGTASGQVYTLRWEPASDQESNIASYELQEREGFTAAWRPMAAVPGFRTGGAVNNIYTVGDPVNPGETPRPLGKCYMYRARAWNFAGSASAWSPISAPACTTIVAAELQAAPALAGAAAGTDSIRWSWTAAPGADGYLVLDAAQDTLSGGLSSATFSWLETGLSPNTAYPRRVQVYNAVSSQVSGETVVYTLPSAPAGLAYSAVAVTSAALSWELNGNGAGTTAQVWRSLDGTNFAGVYEGNAVSFTDAGLQECTEYRFKARNRNPDGFYSGFSPAVSFVTQASTPTPPSGLYAQALEGARIALNWNYSPWPGVTVYSLYSDNGTGTIDYGLPYMVFPSTASFWITPPLAPGTAYKFALRARNRCGIEEKNTTVSASAQAVGVLSGVRAAIVSPQTGKKIKGNSVTVVGDITLGAAWQIKQVRFQYRPQGGAAWTDIAAANANHPNPDLAGPYFVHWDADSMAAGVYEVRALATDIYNADDQAPPTITLVIDPADYEINETVTGGQLLQEQRINSAVSATVQTADETTALLAKLVIPAGAVDAATAAVTMVANPGSTPPPPEGAEDLSLTVKINLSNGQSALSGGGAAAITVSYRDDNNDGIVDGSNAPVERLTMYTSPDGGTTWTEIPTSVDRVKKTVTGLTTHFSLFSVFASPASTLGLVKAYPNPWQPGRGGRFDSAAGVTFANVPTGARIKIFTILGELVRQLEVAAADANTKVWDGNNSEGHKAASGVYIVLVKSGSSDRTFKLAVER